jgi:hypothetical protein
MMVGIFYGHLVHFTVVCFILWTFGILRSNLVYFSRFGILNQEKSGKLALRLLQYKEKTGGLRERTRPRGKN